jgi:uncharacterized protein YgiM (DUF1202 family)
LGLQHSISKPADAAPETVVALQRSYGNRAVQRLTAGLAAEGGTLDGGLSATIGRSQGGGQALADTVRQPLERVFQSDFSGVRVHTDPQADRLSRSLNAEAFTLGQDVYFRKDNFAPGTATGKRLLAHELTHVVQQTGQQTPDVQRKPAETPSYAAQSAQYFNIANQITAIMEGGSTKGNYGALTTINDGGIISYGKHQATLSSGSLGSILNAYIASSTSANAEVIRKNIARVNQKDVTLKDDQNFLDALRGAAGEKEMQIAQDMVFSQGYWDPAVKAAQKSSIQSPLGYAMLYDTKIQGGMEACMKTAQAKCGGKVGDKINGREIAEIDFLKAFNEAREERLEAIAVAAEAKGELVKAKAVRGSKYRCQAFRKLLEAGNLNVSGPEGTVEVAGPGGKAYKIEGFNAAGGFPSAAVTAETKKPASSPQPNLATQGSGLAALAGVALVTAEALNVRQGPDATTTKLGALTRGTQVTVSGRQGDWLRMTYQGKLAFIHSKYVQFTPAVTTPKLNFVEKTYQVGSGIFKQALDAGKDVWNWIGKQFETSTNQGGQPAAANTAAVSPAAAKIAYESQRDNAYDQKDDNGQRVYGGVMCNVTTLAMQLETLAGNKEKAVEAAVQLLQKNGDTTPAPVLRQKQLEDLLMARFDQISKKNEWPTLLGKEYQQAAHWHVQNKIPWNQIASALNRVALEFTAFIAKVEHNEPNDGKGNTLDKLTSEEYYRKTLGPVTENQKAAAMLSTSMTGGHIVMFAQALNDGILINDPYGALLKEAGGSNYVTNGLDRTTAAARIKTAGDGVIKDRLKHNPAALQHVLTVIAPDNKTATKVSQSVGELNFYTWAEVKKFSIGKWNNLLYKK